MLTLEEMEARLLVPGAPPERWLAWKRHFEHGAPAELVLLAREVELDAKRVLDVGCGYGTHLLHFAPSSVGIDRLADHVAFARSIGLRSEVRDVDTLGWNLGLGDFDLVWIANLLGEIEDPSALLASLPTVLAPKGRIVLFERVWPENPRTARGEKKRKTDAEPPHVLAPHRPDPVRRAADVERRRGDPDRASERPAPRRNGGRRERA
ncbi:MAG: methyltransferase domain-containing protein [Planctomycetes bacterium]|nr:methyltransferase domain-containing protein [Planctomycetota bacterium]